MSEYFAIKKSTLVDIADEARRLTGKTGKIISDEIAKELHSVEISLPEIGDTNDQPDSSVPNDGNTRIFIHLEEGRTSPMLCCCPNGTVTVDWGDDTEQCILSGTSISTPAYTPAHEYSKPGDYIITLIVDGEVGFLGNSTYGGKVLCLVTANHVKNCVYSYVVRKVIFGNSVNLSSAVNGFYNLSGLQSITISNSLNSSIANLCFSYCYALANVTFFNGVSSIGSNVFSGCYGVKFYDFSRCTNIPALSNANVFNNISDDCEIRVPASLYSEWIAATNWSTYADQIVAAEEE